MFLLCLLSFQQHMHSASTFPAHLNCLHPADFALNSPFNFAACRVAETQVEEQRPEVNKKESKRILLDTD